MRRKKHGASDEDVSIDMTPMLDIVFIMLIFFIVTTSFVKEKGIEVLRPKETNTPPPPDSKIRTLGIKIDANGVIRMDGREVDIRRVVARVQNFLANFNTDAAAVQAHPKAKHGIVVEVVNQVKIAGIDKVSVLKSEN